MKSHWAGLAGLALSLVLAVVIFGMLPVGQGADGALEGAAFGLASSPIAWIILNAVWINKIQRTTRYWDVLGRAFASLSNDFRIQAIPVAYCFGSVGNRIQALAEVTSFPADDLVSMVGRRNLRY